jgi:molybdopterin-guanine dinucleotide biosynthesis protein A
MGMAKGLIQVHGRPILGHILAQACWPGPTMLVTAPGREHPPGWEAFGAEVSDPEAGQGPLRGVLTALDHLKTPVAVLMPVDMPEFGAAPLRWLVGELRERPRVWGLMTQRESAGGKQVEPLPLALRRAAIEPVQVQMKTGRRSIGALASNPHFAVVPAPDWPERVWLNLNRPVDLPEYGR